MIERDQYIFSNMYGVERYDKRNKTRTRVCKSRKRSAKRTDDYHKYYSSRRLNLLYDIDSQ